MELLEALDTTQPGYGILLLNEEPMDAKIVDAPLLLFEDAANVDANAAVTCGADVVAVDDEDINVEVAT